MSGVRSALNCSFLACRSGFRKCWHFILCYRPHLFAGDEQYHVLCLGLSGAGKSSLLAQLVGDLPGASPAPTNGFNIKTLPLNGIVLSIKELGGSDRVRTFWPNYYEPNDALLYVIDLAAADRVFHESLDSLRRVVAHPELRNKPCMIIATHVEVHGARSERDLLDLLHELLAGRKWKLRCCNTTERRETIDAFTSLTTLIAPTRTRAP